jgi:hypothetical protein
MGTNGARPGRLLRDLLVLFIVASGVVLSGCGGGGSSPALVINVSVAPSSSQAIDQGQKIQFTATVTNDTSSKGVTWSQTGQGALSGQTAGAVTYTSPSSGAAGSAAVTATSVADTTKTAIVNISITPPPSIITTTLPAATLGSAYSQTVSATGGAGTLTYSISSGTLPGGLTLNGNTISGTPTGSAGTANFTVKVTDSSTVNATSATQQLGITVNPAIGITTTSLLNPMVGEAYNQTLKYEDNGGTLPVTWSLASGTLPTGFTLDPSSGAITGTATAGEVGTSTFTVKITDSSAPTQQTATQVLSLTITTATACGSGSESFLSGQYAMSLTGFDASGPVGMLASFTADGKGNITGGVEDINSSGPGGVQANVPITPTGSSYSIGADHRGCLTLVTSLGTKLFRIAVGTLSGGVATNGRSIEFDSSGTNVAGSIQVQQPSAFSNAQVTGNFAFIVYTPLTAAAGGGFFAAVGALNLSGTTVTGVGDMNINGSMDPGNTGYPATPMSFTGGTYNIGSNGRGTLSFMVSISGAPTTINLVVYVLNAGQMNLMSSGAQSATNNLFSGFAGLQTGIPYGNSSLASPSLLFASGQTGPGAAASRVEAGIFTPDGAGNFTFTGDMNSGGAVSTLSESGTYSAAADGRVLLTNTGGTSPTQVMYLVLSNWGYALSTDGNVMIGDSAPQSGIPFTNASLNGTFSFGTIIPVVAGSRLMAGEATYDGAGNVSITFDVNEGGFLSINNVVTESYAASSSGRVVTPAGGTTLTVGYIAFPGTIVSLTLTDINPTLSVMQQ